MKNFFAKELNAIKILKSDLEVNSSGREKYLSGGLLIASSFLGNIFNFLYNAYLSRSKVITLEQFGLLSLIGSFVYISQVPLGAVTRTVTHKSAFLLGKYGFVVINFWSNIRKKLFLLSVGLALIWLFSIPALEKFFKSTELIPFLVFTPVWIIGMLIAVDSGFLNGNLHFKQVGILIIVEAVSKLILTVFLVSIGLNKWVYISIPLSMTFAFLFGWFFVLKIKIKKVISHRSIFTFPVNFFWTSILRTLSILSFLGLDIVLAKLFLTPKETGAFALLSLAGKMIYIIGGEISQFILPVVSKEEGARRNSENAFYKLIIATTATCLMSYLIFGLFGFITAPLLWGEKSKIIIQFLPYYTLSMVFFTISSAIVSYHQAKKDLILPILNFILASLQVMLLFLFHNTLQQFILTILINSIFSITVICFFHFYYYSISRFISNLSVRVLLTKIFFKRVFKGLNFKIHMKLINLLYIFPSYIHSFLAHQHGEQKKVLLPKNIGKYTLIKNLRKMKIYPFAIGLYEYNNQKYVAKVWIGKRKNIHYYELEHEINTLKTLIAVQNRLKFNGKQIFRISPFTESIREDNYLVMISRYVSGKPLSKINNVNKQIKIYFESINYINLIGKHCTPIEKAKLRVRNIRFLFLIFPVIFIIALIKRKSIYKLLIKGLIKYLKNIFGKIDWDRLVLVHGDLHTDNILLNKENCYIFDFEQTMFSYPQYEFISTLSSLRSGRLFLEVLLNKVQLLCNNDMDYRKKMETIIIQCSTHNLTSNLQQKSIDVYIKLLKAGFSINEIKVFNYNKIYLS